MTKPASKPGTTTPTAKKAGRGKNSRAWRIVGRSFAVLGILVLVMALVTTIAALVFYQRTELPDPNKDFNTNTTFIYYNDGTTKMGNFAVQNRQTISYEQMGAPIKDAVVAAENRSFWTDRGISPTGIARSAFSILRGGEIQGGGSTITQQYIKIYYLTSDRTMTRKMRELALAVKMGRQVPKEQILRDYLNTIYFGRGAYGIQAASRSYFLTDAKNLTIEQSAVLASVLNNPSLFDPSEGESNSARLLDRYRYVLDGMLEMGTITQEQHAQAYKGLPEFPEIPVNNRYAGPNGHLMKMVRDELLNRGFTDAQINGGGLQVTTTFDKALQDHAVKVAQDYTAKVAAGARPAQDASKLHVALSSVDVATGEVLAMYGGPDYLKSTRNWATTPRASASTFKAYAAVAGLRDGFSLRSTFNGNTFTPDGDSATVRNEFGHQYGENVSLLRATEQSINTAFVDMTQQIDNGPAQVVKAANDAGIPTGSGWDLNNRISLGTAEVSPLDNAVGFATLVNDGKKASAHVIKEVKDLDGKVVHSSKTSPTQAIEPDIAADVTHALKSVVDQGTGGAVGNLGHDIAGKTGTSGVGDAITSAWFVAATKQISTSVMYVVGDAGTGDLDPYKRPGDGTFYGGTYPAQTWAAFMKAALQGKPNVAFTEPAWVNTEKNDPSPSVESSPSTETSQTESTPPPSSESSTPPPSTEQSTQAPTTSAAPTTTEPPAPVTTAPPETTQVPTSIPVPTVEPTVTRTATNAGTPGGGNRP
ncbi:penicillin-binding protein [Tessaracoccus sp. SD287]|uniref:transglycosylase domain-containing protein n=1 Tax=Tessaracoccus sp. SD287 TaxID=2782008 RepID=UPI001A96A543|nr:transglycosylase domain-containing protein [Tessaracoccus sp. SD287]MBO1031956.1 penicillin-binding protein [Tessaracoccus sp. SD287]